MRMPFTGRHMAAILVAFFAIVIAVNLIMARYAATTFGGVVVENSYVASQHFNTWLDNARAQETLGWEARIMRQQDGRLVVTLKGAPSGTTLAIEARHPLGRLPDRRLTFVTGSEGRYQSRESLPMGRWTLRLKARSGNTVWRKEETLT